MRVLFTGTSSFTGYWLVRALADRGHEVIGACTQPSHAYAGIRQNRLRQAARAVRLEYDCPFGSDRFVDVVEQADRWDLLCHHGAAVLDYKSPDFDYLAALGNNTKRVGTVLRTLAERGCRAVLLTGSVFEADEGAGDPPHGAVSAYALSKGLTADVVRYFCERTGLRLGKFVIPNPFGPYEDARFTRYLITTWRTGQVPTVRTPDYVRDNIHADLLARCYAHFADTMLDRSIGTRKLNPSGYIESQGAFARRVAREVGTRLGLPTPLEFAAQTEFDEPRIRINTQPAVQLVPEWDDETAWDRFVEYYAAAN
jgi:UDP-glucose 4-epimerase